MKTPLGSTNTPPIILSDTCALVLNGVFESQALNFADTVRLLLCMFFVLSCFSTFLRGIIFLCGEVCLFGVWLVWESWSSTLMFSLKWVSYSSLVITLPNTSFLSLFQWFHSTDPNSVLASEKFGAHLHNCCPFLEICLFFLVIFLIFA